MSVSLRLVPRFAASRFIATALAMTAFGAPRPSATLRERAAPDLYVQILDCGFGEIKDVSGFSSGFDRGVSQTFVDPCYLISPSKRGAPLGHRPSRYVSGFA